MFKHILHKPAIARFMLIAALVLMTTAVGAQLPSSDTITLTLRQAEQQFLERNLILLAGHFNVDANKALIQQAKLWDNPVLTTDQNIYANGQAFSHGKNLAGQPNGQVFIQVSQLIKTAGKRSKQINLATTTVRLAELQLQDVLRNLKYQLRSNYYTVAKMLSVQQIYNQQLRELSRLLQAMEAQLKAGNIAQKDYLRVQAEVIALKQDIVESNRNLADVQAELRTILQLPPTAFVKPADSLAYNTFLVPPVSELLDTAKANNPLFLLQQQQIVYQQQNLLLQKALQTPDLTVAPEYDAASNYTPHYFGLTLSLPLPLLNRNQGNIKAAGYAVKQEQATLQQSETELTNNIARAYEKLMLTMSQNSNQQNVFYKSYQAMFSNMLQSYRQRQIGLLEFIDFFDAFKEANVRLQNQQLNLNLAKEELNFEAGTDIIKNELTH